MKTISIPLAMLLAVTVAYPSNKSDSSVATQRSPNDEKHEFGSTELVKGKLLNAGTTSQLQQEPGQEPSTYIPQETAHRPKSRREEQQLPSLGKPTPELQSNSRQKLPAKDEKKQQPSSGVSSAEAALKNSRAAPTLPPDFTLKPRENRSLLESTKTTPATLTTRTEQVTTNLPLDTTKPKVNRALPTKEIPTKPTLKPDTVLELPAETASKSKVRRALPVEQTLSKNIEKPRNNSESQQNFRNSS